MDNDTLNDTLKEVLTELESSLSDLTKTTHALQEFIAGMTTSSPNPVEPASAQAQKQATTTVQSSRSIEEEYNEYIDLYKHHQKPPTLKK